MSPAKITCTFSVPCFAVFCIARWLDDPASVTVALVVVVMAVMAMSFIMSCRVEWSNRDAFLSGTKSVMAELNERNERIHSMQCRIAALRAALRVPDYSDLMESLERNLPHRGEEE